MFSDSIPKSVTFRLLSDEQHAAFGKSDAWKISLAKILISLKEGDFTHM